MFESSVANSLNKKTYLQAVSQKHQTVLAKLELPHFIETAFVQACIVFNAAVLGGRGRDFYKEYLFGFETLVFATSGILSMHNQLVTLQRESKTWNLWPL